MKLCKQIISPLERLSTNLVERQVRPVPGKKQLRQVGTVSRMVNTRCWTDAVPSGVWSAVDSCQKLVSAHECFQEHRDLPAT